MKVATILFIVGLTMSPIIGLAQTSDSQISSQAITISPQTNSGSPITIKCGVNTFAVKNECGINAYKNAYAQCYDGHETTLGDTTSCKSSETWQQYTKEVCANHCSNSNVGGGGGTTTAPSVPTSQPIIIKNIPITVSIDHCNEVAQWETKIAYYKKLSNLSDDELKKNGFSREEIGKILQELSLGIEKVRGKCDGREKTPAMPRITAITGSASIEETVKPVVVGSGQEISDYYKARIEKAISVKEEGKQIQELKTLRDEIDGLISNLIKSRKELEVSELNTLVKEVKVSRGEIKADDISVKTTEKKMLISVGNRPISIEPTVNQVLIRDKGLEVNANEVTIKENVLSVGGVDVKMSASEVTEKLGLAPKTIELKQENTKAVYDMKIEERRKLFGFIPFNSQRIIIADAENGNTLSERLPWYNFMTTK